MTVAELDRRISSSELTEWMVYEQITGPLGPDRGDIQAAIVASTIANAMSSKKSKRFALRDFLPTWDRPKQTPEDQLRMVRALNRAFGGTDTTRREPDGDAGRTDGAGRRRHRRPRKRPR